MNPELPSRRRLTSAQINRLSKGTSPLSPSAEVSISKEPELPTKYERDPGLITTTPKLSKDNGIYSVVSEVNVDVKESDASHDSIQKPAPITLQTEDLYKTATSYIQYVSATSTISPSPSPSSATSKKKRSLTASELNKSKSPIRVPSINSSICEISSTLEGQTTVVPYQPPQSEANVASGEPSPTSKDTVQARNLIENKPLKEYGDGGLNISEIQSLTSKITERKEVRQRHNLHNRAKFRTRKCNVQVDKISSLINQISHRDSKRIARKTLNLPGEEQYKALVDQLTSEKAETLRLYETLRLEHEALLMSKNSHQLELADDERTSRELAEISAQFAELQQENENLINANTILQEELLKHLGSDAIDRTPASSQSRLSKSVSDGDSDEKEETPAETSLLLEVKADFEAAQSKTDIYSNSETNITVPSSAYVAQIKSENRSLQWQLEVTQLELLESKQRFEQSMARNSENEERIRRNEVRSSLALYQASKSDLLSNQSRSESYKNDDATVSSVPDQTEYELLVLENEALTRSEKFLQNRITKLEQVLDNAIFGYRDNIYTLEEEIRALQSELIHQEKNSTKLTDKLERLLDYAILSNRDNSVSYDQQVTELEQKIDTLVRSSQDSDPIFSSLTCNDPSQIAELRKLKADAENWKVEREELENQIQTLLDEIDNLKNDTNDNKSESDEERHPSVGRLDNNHENWDSEKKLLEEQLQRQMDEIYLLKEANREQNNNSALQQRVTELEDELKAVKSENIELEAERQKLQDDDKGLILVSDKSNIDVADEEIRQRLKTLENAAEIWKSEKAELEAQIRSQLEEINYFPHPNPENLSNTFEERIHELERNITALISENTALEAQIRTLSALHKTTQERDGELQLQLTNMESDAAILKSDKGILEDQIRTLLDEIDTLRGTTRDLNQELQQRLESMKRDSILLNSEKMALEAQITTLQDEIDMLHGTTQGGNDELQQQFANMKSEKAALESQIRALLDEIDKLHGISHEHNVLQKRLLNVESESANLKAEKVILEDKLSTLLDEIDVLRKTTLIHDNELHQKLEDFEKVAASWILEKKELENRIQLLLNENSSLQLTNQKNIHDFEEGWQQRVDKLENAVTILKDRIRVRQEELESCQLEIFNLNETILSGKDESKLLEAKIAELTLLLASKTKEYDLNLIALEKETSDACQLKIQLDSVTLERISLVSEKQAWISREKTLENSIEALNQRLKIAENGNEKEKIFLLDAKLEDALAQLAKQSILLESRTEELSSLVAERKVWVLRESELQAGTKALEARLKAAEEQISVLKTSTNQESTTTTKALEDKLAKMKESFVELTEIHRLVVKEHDASRLECFNLNEEISNLETVKSELQTELDSCKSELRACQKELTAASETYVTALTDKKQLEQNKAQFDPQLSEKLETSTRELQSTQTELASVQAELAAVRGQVKELEEKQQQSPVETNIPSILLESNSSESKMWLSDTHASEIDTSSITKKCEKLERKLAKLLKVAESLKETNRELTENLDASRLECYNLKEQLTDYQNRIKSQAAELKSLNSNQASKPSRNSESANEKLKLTEELEAMRIQFFNLTEQLEESENLIQLKDKEMKEVSKKLRDCQKALEEKAELQLRESNETDKDEKVTYLQTELYEMEKAAKLSEEKIQALETQIELYEKKVELIQDIDNLRATFTSAIEEMEDKYLQVNELFDEEKGLLNMKLALAERRVEELQSKSFFSQEKDVKDEASNAEIRNLKMELEATRDALAELRTLNRRNTTVFEDPDDVYETLADVQAAYQRLKRDTIDKLRAIEANSPTTGRLPGEYLQSPTTLSTITRPTLTSPPTGTVANGVASNSVPILPPMTPTSGSPATTLGKSTKEYKYNTPLQEEIEPSEDELVKKVSLLTPKGMIAKRFKKEAQMQALSMDRLNGNIVGLPALPPKGGSLKHVFWGEGSNCGSNSVLLNDMTCYSRDCAEKGKSRGCYSSSHQQFGGNLRVVNVDEDSEKGKVHTKGAEVHEKGGTKLQQRMFYGGMEGRVAKVESVDDAPFQDFVDEVERGVPGETYTIEGSEDAAFAF
ncbi:hypothetical protein HDU79_006177 [Rhizoclosmatium sp. JEL0117]|nr:hypothetical protein HDU79_006177 [Rhizoclosmatium sp. JEL0117]